MKQIITLMSIFVTAFILMSCSAGRYPYPTHDLGQEDWRGMIETDANRWALKADQWFLAGGPSPSAIANQQATYGEAISRETVRVSNFNTIRVNGDFQVQIVGSPYTDSVTIEGPNAKVRAIDVTVSNNGVLCITQLKKAPPGMGQVIVRICIKQLHRLEHNGTGNVEGIRLNSNNLQVVASGCSNIFLAGHLNVTRIIARGPGTVNIFTIDSNDTEIQTSGNGSVNLSARRAVWLRSITHYGTGNVNVIGARSRHLMINTSGSGKIGISGHVSVKEIRASGKTYVFIENSTSDMPCIYVYDNAQVGIAGRAGIFSGYTTRNSRLWARYLLAHTSYLEASGTSHMNVYATDKVFATVSDYATIYYYGDPAILTPFERNYGTVINMGTPNTQFEVITRRRSPSQAPRRISSHYMPTRIKMGLNERHDPAQYLMRKNLLVQLPDDQRYV